MKENIIADKSFNFSVKIINLYNRLISEHKEYTLSKQLLRSGTSIGANVAESILSISKADFKNKLCISLKEAKETEYWIKLLSVTNYLTKEDSIELLNDCSELLKILTAIVKTCNTELSC